VDEGWLIENTLDLCANGTLSLLPSRKWLLELLKELFPCMKLIWADSGYKTSISTIEVDGYHGREAG
jgi:hypothetical protein